MSRSIGRLLAIPFALLGFCLTSWFTYIGWMDKPLTMVAGMMVALWLPALVYLYVLRAKRQRLISLFAYRGPVWTLTPSGLRQPWYAFFITHSWDDLEPAIEEAKTGDYVRVKVRDDRRASSPKVQVPTFLMATDPGFLAFAIRHYIVHPEARTDIGGHAELDRLKAAFAAQT